MPAATPPIPDQFSVDYAPTDRACCKECSGLISQDAVRFCRKVRSPFHDGFDTQYRHFKCGVQKQYAKTLDEIRGLFGLKWSDTEKCAKAYGVELNTANEEVQEYKHRSDLIWSIQPKIASIPMSYLKLILEHNGMVVSKNTRAPEAALIIADGLLFGKLPNCLICEQPALLQQGAEIYCKGFLEESNTRCPFRYTIVNLLNPDDKKVNNEATGIKDVGELNRIGPYDIPAECLRLSFFKNWKPKKDPLVAKAQTSFSNKDQKPKKTKRITEKSEDELEADVPTGWELAGLSFTSIGKLNMAKSSLIDTVEQHKGTFTDKILPSISYVLMGAEDEAATKLKKYEEFKTLGFPILDVDFIPSLLSRTPIYPKSTAVEKAVVSSSINNSSRNSKKRTFSQGAAVKAETVKVKEECVIIDKKIKIEGRKSITTKTEQKEEKVAEVKKQKVQLNVEAGEIDRRPKGLILRQRKYAKYYLLRGKMPDLPFVTVKSIIAKEENKKSIESSVESVGKVKRPKPKADSQILHVDAEYPITQRSCIFVDSFNDVYSFTTLYSDITTGINKFYTCQLINESSVDIIKSKVCFFRKWGRVGERRGGVKNRCLTEIYESVEEAVESFEQKFNELTGIEWSERYNKSPVAGRYRYIDMEDHLGTGDAADRQKDGGNAEEHQVTHLKDEEITAYSDGGGGEPPSSLVEPLKALIQLIFNRQMMEDALADQNVDLAKMPLGQISKNQMMEGYKYLCQLQSLLVDEMNEKGSMKWSTRVTAISNKFYTAIPHSFRLSQTPPPINSVDLLKRKIEMMEQLLEIGVAATIMKDAVANAKAVCKLDSYYAALHCCLTPVDRQSDAYACIQSALTNTHAVTHNTYSMNILDLYECRREGEMERYSSFVQRNQIDKAKLLWHGSRLSNWVGVVTQGLRVAPKEAPMTGYMFDKGIYFADMVSKSANYCFATPENPFGVISLCEVALGKPYYKLHAQGNAKSACMKNGCNYTWGLGETIPDWNSVAHMASSTFSAVPLHTGTGVNSKDFVSQIQKEDPNSGLDNEESPGSLLYNEYVVYEEDQVLLRYILRLEFCFKTFLDGDDSNTTSSSSVSSSSDSEEEEDEDLDYENYSDDD